MAGADEAEVFDFSFELVRRGTVLLPRACAYAHDCIFLEQV
jgi:hypothetical protein